MCLGVVGLCKQVLRKILAQNAGVVMIAKRCLLRFASARELVSGALKLLPDRVLENCEEPQIVR